MLSAVIINQNIECGAPSVLAATSFSGGAITGFFFCILMCAATAILRSYDKWRDARKSRKDLSSIRKDEPLTHDYFGYHQESYTTYNSDGTPKEEKSYIPRIIRKHPRVLLLSFFAACLTIGFIGNRVEKRKIEQQKIEWQQYAESLPNDGTQRNYWPNEKGDKFVYEFESPARGWNVLVRFFNDDAKVLAADLFIRAGVKKTFIALVPGRYKIVYAYGGNTWYGYKRLWGLSTVFGDSRAITEVTEEGMSTRWRGKKYVSSMWRSSSEASFGSR